MKIALSITGKDLDSQVDPRFGRCDWFAIVDTDSLSCETIQNPAQASPQGAGIQAAQAVVDKNVEAVITGNIGPNAFQVLSVAGIRAFDAAGLPVRQAVEMFKQDKLAEISNAGPAHAGYRRRQSRN
jgi:predicted Fe-Mo cluster-binding NifX family protein